MKLITEVLKIQYPILQGGMAWVSEARLAAAVSNAGGAGIISAGGREASYVREQIRAARQLTKLPFGVNVQLMSPNKEEIVDVICEEKVAFTTLGAGNPVPYFERLGKAGVKIIPVVPNVRLAKRVAAAGADALIVEGMEAGGHIGSLTTMALMTQVIPAVGIPVIAAGGFADGRGVAAALLMGAAGVQMGTRFLIAEECQAHPKVKERLLAADDTDSIVTGQTIGHAVRGIKNKFSLNFIAMEKSGAGEEQLVKLATGTNRLAAVEGDIENGMILAGQSLLPLQRIEPVKKIIDDLMAEAKETLMNAGKIPL